MSVTAAHTDKLLTHGNPMQSWSGHSVTYSFITDGNPPTYYSEESNALLRDPVWGFGNLTTAADANALGANQQASVLAAMAAWSSVADITFNPTTGTGQISLGQIPYGSGSQLEQSGAVGLG